MELLFQLPDVTPDGSLRLAGERGKSILSWLAFVEPKEEVFEHAVEELCGGRAGRVLHNLNGDDDRTPYQGRR